MNVKIKDLPINERPRERLIQYGVDKLTNEELLSILIKNGTKNESVKALSNNILVLINDITNLRKINYQQLVKIKGIGEAKACLLLSSIELGKRVFQNNQVIKKEIMNNAKVIFDYYKNILYDKKQEHFYAVYLDSKKRIIDDRLLFIGTINQSLVHPRNIFKEACLLDASSIVCVHNHPSGSVIPSKEDKLMTERITSIGNMMGISVIDHIIVGNTNYYSFFENNEI